MLEIVNSLFEKFQNTAIGKYLLKSASFNSNLKRFGSALVGAVIVYGGKTWLEDIIDKQLELADGWVYIVWFMLSQIIPVASLFLIVVLLFILVGAWHIESKRLDVEKLKLKDKIQKALTTIPATPNFVGRKKEFKEIDKILKSHSLLALNGIGGIGKSSLVSNYVSMKKDSYDYYAVVEVAGDIRLSLFGALKTSLVLKEHEKIEENFVEVLTALQKLEGKILLVLDNIADIKNQSRAIEKIIRLKSPNFHLLFSSREEIPDMENIQLDALDKEDAKKLFNSIYKVKNNTKLEQILGYIGYHTLFIDKIAKTLKNHQNSLSVDELIAKFKDEQFPTIKEKYDEKDFSALLDKLFSFDALHEDAIVILQRFSALPSIEILFKELLRLFCIDDKGEFEAILNHLVEKGWLISDSQNRDYKLHQIIKEYIWEHHFPPYEVLEPILDMMIEDFKNVNEILEALRHKEDTIYIESLFKVLKEEDKKIATFFNQSGVIYYHLGEHEKALPLYEEALKIHKKALGEQHLNTAESYNNLARLYTSMGKYEKALPLYEKDLTINKTLFGTEHPNTASSYNSLAELYRITGQYEKALPLYQKALTISETVLGKEHLHTASVYSNLAELYRATGQYKKAKPLIEKALAINETVLGKEHPLTATSYNNLAGLYQSMGEYEQAKTLLEKDLTISETVFGKEHPRTATSYNNLAGLYYSIGEYNKAKTLLEKALAIHETVLGKKHPDTLMNYTNLSGIYQSMEEFDKAKKYIQKALTIQKEVLPKGHHILIDLLEKQETIEKLLNSR